MLKAKATRVIQASPPAALVQLIKEDCDGGLGEYDEFTPKSLRKHADQHDSTWWPRLAKTASGALNVVWDRIQ